MLKALLSITGVYKLYEKWLLHQLKNNPKPEHVAIILDGNRRWAMEKDLDPWFGHEKGAEKVEQLLDWCAKIGVKTITIYAFSTENFRRPKNEVEEIMRIAAERLQKILTDERIHRNRIHVKVIGRINLLPEHLQKLIAEVENATAEYQDYYLNIAFAYGGRAEIVDAAKRIADKVRSNELDPEDVNESLFEKFLYTSHLPKQEPDLIVRTSGEERLSGFLLWQSAYSELCFLDVYWPDFRFIDLLRAIRTFQKRKRRFGA
ncbi:MAG: polyprenyl diphosphate synthase [Candidatus Bathyarchaeota archaeon]|nr:polyprenyl diphosphate synthase [Candidatus Bathyarchaeota archaeon]MCX8177457.1 polyprenyl diphosphate synthase [Candidatus Bathyarchaeota archaeon]MDW8194124.1 polyprenyl diphosphate synthase [Nitrososphaerota archaeon]